MNRYFFINKIIKASDNKPKGTKGIYLKSHYPKPISALIFINTKDKKKLSIFCKETDKKLLKLFAKTIFIMYQKETGIIPKEITFITYEKKIKIKKYQLETITLNPLLKLI